MLEDGSRKPVLLGAAKGMKQPVGLSVAGGHQSCSEEKGGMPPPSRQGHRHRARCGCRA